MFNFLMKKETTLIVASIIAFMIVLVIIVKVPSVETVHATGTQEGTYKSESILVQGQVQNTITKPTGESYVVCYGNTVTPIFTTTQMTDWILRKGNELIAIFQDIAFPFCVITFILATFITIFGLLTGNAGQGLIGMSASAIGYAAILYAPMLVNVVVCFVSN